MPNEDTLRDWRRSTRSFEFLRSTTGSGRERFFCRHPVWLPLGFPLK